MAKKIHGAWSVLTAIWLTVAPPHAHASHDFRQQAVPLHTKTASAARTSATGCAKFYTVRKGDTLVKIARRCGVSVTSLKRLNGLTQNTIRVGQILVVRGSSGSTSAAGGSKVTPAPTPTIESSVSPW